MKVLHAIASMDPRQGGTVEALAQLVKAAEPSGQTHEVLSLDDPQAVDSFAHPFPIHAVGPTQRFYGDTPKLDQWFKEHLDAYQVAVIHGCWQYHGLALARACWKRQLPYLQYPHGMLDPWFKRRYPLKHLKKWLYWPWAEYRILKKAQKVVFTCEEEKQQASQSFWLYQVNPVVIPLGIKEPDIDFSVCERALYSSFPQLQDKRMLTFMSRIHEKKGVNLLIDAALKVQENCSPNEKPVTLVIAGPCEDPKYLEDLKFRAETLARSGPFEAIRWLPMVKGNEKWGLLRKSEAFILPSHQENFGMVVAESLFCGTPVLISDKINIWNEISSKGAAIVGEDSIEGTINLIQEWLRLNLSQREAMSFKASECFKENFNIRQNASKLFASLAGIVKTHD